MSNLKAVIIAGSARKDGDTEQLVRLLGELSQWLVIDLNDYQIGHYDYEHRNKDDDFLPLMRRLIREYDTYVLATPVYWYAMSGTMKVFFDRLTDLLTIEQDLGRQLRGKKMAAISCSIGNNLGEIFWLPFSETANYLGMQYLGDLHTLAGQFSEQELKHFIGKIRSDHR